MYRLFWVLGLGAGPLAGLIAAGGRGMYSPAYCVRSLSVVPMA